MLEHSERLDRGFHALSDRTRRAIVERLARGSATVSELAQPMEMTLAAVVQHVQVLEQSGIVRTEKVGRVRSCHLEKRALSTIEKWISDRKSTWERNLDRLGDYLTETADKPAKAKGKKP